MNKWFVIGGLLLVVSWLPFLVGEWSRKDISAGEDTDAALVAGETKARTPVMPKPLAADPTAVAPVAPAADPELEAEPEVAEAPEDESEPPAAEDDTEEESPTSVPVGNTTALTRMLKETFDSETRDALWAEEREKALGSLAGQAGVRLKDGEGLRCQRTVCRIAVEVTSEESSKMMAFYYSVLRNQPLGEDMQPLEPAEPPSRAFGIETVPTEDPEKAEAFIYVGREGYHNVLPK